jgi:hypothetical protein
MKIGIDIGNVIIGGGGEDTFFTPKYLETPEVDGAWTALDRLDDSGHELHFISKCGPTVEGKTLKWLKQEQFELSVPLHRTHFVRQRNLKVFMAMALELDVFIDDREDIIESMRGFVKHRILFTSWDQTNRELAEIFAKASER